MFACQAGHKDISTLLLEHGELLNVSSVCNSAAVIVFYMGCHSGQNYAFTIIHKFEQLSCFSVQLTSGSVQVICGTVQLVSRTFKQNRKSDQHYTSDSVRRSPSPADKSAA